MRFGIFIDAERDSGLGHVRRSLLLRSYLLKIGMRVDIYVSIKSDREIFRGVEDVFTFSYDLITDELIEQIYSRHTNMLIMDTYLMPLSTVQIFANKLPSIPILAFDDFGEKIDWPIIGVINAGLGFSAIEYPGRFYLYSILGPSYFAVPNECLRYSNYLQRKSPKRKKLTVVMGGGDQEGQTLRIFNIIKKIKLNKKAEIELIFGPGFKHQRKVLTLSDRNQNLSVKISPSKFHKQIMSADYVISGCGITLLELIFLKKFLGGLALAENQLPSLSYLHRYGNAIGYYKDVPNYLIAKKLKKLISLNCRKLNFSAEKPNLVTANGGYLLAKKIVEAYKRYSGNLYSIDDTIIDYQKSSESEMPHEKVKWASNESMVNQFKMGLELVKNYKFNKWLDIGSGTGDILRNIDVLKNKNVRYFGIDLCPELISYAKGNCKEVEAEISFACQNFMDPISEEPFDLITCFGVLQKSGVGIREALVRMSKCLTLGGIIIISTKNLSWSAFNDTNFKPYSGHSWFTVSQIEDAFISAGLEIVAIRGFDATRNKFLDPGDAHSIFVVGKKNEYH